MRYLVIRCYILLDDLQMFTLWIEHISPQNNITDESVLRMQEIASSKRSVYINRVRVSDKSLLEMVIKGQEVDRINPEDEIL